MTSMTAHPRQESPARRTQPYLAAKKSFLTRRVMEASYYDRYAPAGSRGGRWGTLAPSQIMQVAGATAQGDQGWRKDAP